MQLSVREAAEILKVSEKSIYRWIKEGTLPAYNIHGQYRFNRTELLEWATAQKVNVSVDILMEPETAVAPLPTLSDALVAGGVFYRIGGEDKAAVIRNVVDVMRLADEVDREFLVQVLLARESLGSTAVGDGIAIPHVRNPIVMHIARPMVSLCFLERPIDFGALDGRPVNVLFTLVSPTVRSHLHLLARLAFALRDPGFKDVVLRQGSKEEILSEARRVERAS